MKRLLLFALSLFSAISLVHAQEASDKQTWFLVTDNGQKAEMADVACLVAADDEATFNVVLSNGTSLTDVRRAYFKKEDPTGIRLLEGSIVSGRDSFTIMTVPPTTHVAIYTTDGRLMKNASAQHVDISTLPKGIYLLKVNHVSFKFEKK